MNMTVQIVGLVWYELETYERARSLMADGHLLPRTFSEWRLKAEQGERQMRRQGVKTVRALIDPDTFGEWCRERGLNVDAKARIQFANLVAKQAHDRDTMH